MPGHVFLESEGAAFDFFPAYGANDEVLILVDALHVIGETARGREFLSARVARKGGRIGVQLPMSIQITFAVESLSADIALKSAWTEVFP